MGHGPRVRFWEANIEVDVAEPFDVNNRLLRESNLTKFTFKANFPNLGKYYSEVGICYQQSAKVILLFWIKNCPLQNGRNVP